jgi:glycosyltransferase involved in cell wall biosynthesis
MPGVTFIVTVYNKAPFLDACVRSLVEQVGDFERQYVFVNDGSTDGSGERLRDLLAQVPDATLIDQANAGPGPATNRAARLARHELLKPLDADDVLAPYATRLLMDELERHRLGLVYGGLAWYGAEGPRFEPRPLGLQTRVFEDPIYEALDTRQAGSSNLLVRTDLFRRAGGCDTRVFIQDQGICPRVAAVDGARIGAFSHVIAMGPEDDPGRLMKNRAQILHDATLTALLFLRDHPELPARLRRVAFRRCAARAYRRSRRPFGGRVLASEHAILLQARLGILWRHEALIERTLETFARGGSVRRPAEVAVAPLEEGAW